jgi:sulfoacetaldehyde dehydrogenase
MLLHSNFLKKILIVGGNNMIDEIDIKNNLINIVSASKLANAELENKSQKFIDNLINSIALKILDKKINRSLSTLAVKETKFGNINDKIKKNHNKTINLLSDLKKFEIFKPLYDKQKNIYEIYKPIGVICGVTPSTNPIATPLNYILNSIKARNSIIICPNPRAYKTAFELINIIKKVLIKKRISQNLVNIAPKNILRDETIIDLFNLCDKNIVTGNQLIISRVKKSIKPFLIFGAGNVPVIVDKTADIKKAAESIVLSKSFDNSTSCSADSVIIVDKNIYSTFIKNLKANDVYLLNRNEQSKLDKIYYNKGMINNEIIAKNSNVILEKIGVKNNKFSYKLVAYEIHDFDNEHYIFDEKILPLVGIIPSKNIENAIELAKKILDKKGKGHSAGIYSKSKKNIMKLSMATSVSRIIVNQPHSQSAGGSTNNYLKSTLSLGCGTWGNNLINENLYLKDFCNTTKVVFKKK